MILYIHETLLLEKDNNAKGENDNAIEIMLHYLQQITIVKYQRRNMMKVIRKS